MNYNPYDLLDVSINGQRTHARVLALDSDIVDQVKSTNQKGYYVVPKDIITMCPNCACPLQMTVDLPQPPFPVVTFNCSNCHPELEPETALVDPFTSGRITLNELCPQEEEKITRVNPENVSFTLEKFTRNVDRTTEIEEDFIALTEESKEDTEKASSTSKKPKAPPKVKKSKENEKKGQEGQDESHTR